MPHNIITVTSLIFTAVEGEAVSLVETLKTGKKNVSDFLDLFRKSNSEKMEISLTKTLKDDIGHLKAFESELLKGTERGEAFSSTMSKASENAQKYAQSVDATTINIGQFKTEQEAAIQKTVAHTAATKANIVAQKALAVALNLGVMAAITGVTMLITYLIERQEKLRQSALEAVNAYSEQSKSLDDYAKKIKDLRTQLDANDTSEQQRRSLKEQLLDIQNQLIATYGKEVDGLSLVNGELENQIGLLTELNAKKASQLLTEQNPQIDKAIEEMTKERTFTIGYSISRHGNSFDAIMDIVKAFEDKGIYYDNSSVGHGAYRSQIILDANAIDATSTIDDFAKQIRKLKDEFADDPFSLEQISNLEREISYAFTEAQKTVDKYSKIFTEGLTARLVADPTKSNILGDYITAIDTLNKALISGDDKVAKNAIDNFNAAQNAVDGLVSESGEFAYVFDDVKNGLDSASLSAYNFTQAFDKDDKLKSFAEQLRGLTDIDLQAIRFDNTEIEQGEESFRALVDEAVAGGMSIEQAIQHVINKLVEWGYVQGEVAQDTAQTFGDLSKSVQEAKDSTSTLLSSLNMSSNAFKEQAENGSLCVDTQLALADAGYASALAFDEETGAAYLNRDAFIELVKIKIQNQINDLQMLQINLANKLIQEGQAAIDAAGGINANSSAKAQNVIVTDELAKAQSRLNEAMAGGIVDTSSADYQYYEELEARINALKNAFENVGSIAGGTYSTGIQKAKDSTKDLINALKDAQSALKDILALTIAMLKKQFADQKEALQEILSALTERYNRERDEIKKTYDEAKKALDKEKKELQKLNKERKKAYDDAKKAEKALYDEAKKRHDQEVKKLKEELELYRKRIKEQIDALSKQEDERDYQKELIAWLPCTVMCIEKLHI